MDQDRVDVKVSTSSSTYTNIYLPFVTKLQNTGADLPYVMTAAVTGSVDSTTGLTVAARSFMVIGMKFLTAAWAAPTVAAAES